MSRTSGKSNFVIIEIDFEVTRTDDAVGIRGSHP